MNNKKTVVVGFGSFNGDDQAGWLVIDKLEKECNSKDIICFKSKADGADWFPIVENSAEVIFIDAVKSGGSIGTIHLVKDIDECKKIFPTSSHTINIFESISLAQALGYLNSPFQFFGIEIRESKILTEQVADAVLRVTAKLEGKLLRC